MFVRGGLDTKSLFFFDNPVIAEEHDDSEFDLHAVEVEEDEVKHMER